MPIVGTEYREHSGVMYVKASVLKSRAGRIRDWSILSACWPKGRCTLHSWLRLQGDCPNGKLDLPTSRAQFFFTSAKRER